MCFGGGSPQQPKVAKYESKNDPVVITGEQEGLEKKRKKLKQQTHLRLQNKKRLKTFLTQLLLQHKS